MQMVNFCLKVHLHHLGMILALTIFTHSTVTPHLTLLTYFIARIRCQPQILMNSYKSGQPHWIMVKIHCLSISNIFTTPLMPWKLETCHGAPSACLSMAVIILKVIRSLPGSRHPMMCGSKIHVLSYISSSETETSTRRWTLQQRKYVMRKGQGYIQTSCLGTLHGDIQCI